MSCSNGCNAARTECNDCMPGAKMCNGGDLVTCRSDGTGFGNPLSCSNGCSSARKACNDCMPGAPRCNGRSLETCSSDGGGFGNPTSCGFGCSQARSECNKCEPNARTCNGTGNVDVCKADGSGTLPDPCPAAGVCKVTTCTGGTCGEKPAAQDNRCDSDGKHECTAGDCVLKSLCQNKTWDYNDNEQCDPSADQWKNVGNNTCTADCKLKRSIYGVCKKAGDPCWPGGTGWFCSAVGACTRVCTGKDECPEGICLLDPITPNQGICVTDGGCENGTSIQWVGREGCFSNSTMGCADAKPIPPVRLCGWLSIDPVTPAIWCPQESKPCCEPTGFGGGKSSTCI